MRPLAPLQKGDHVAIVATAKRVEFEIDLALQTLKSWGLVPVLGQHVLGQSEYFANTIDQSLDDLHWALEDPAIKGVIFLRGGYGTTRILDQINFPDRLKWMIGFSDLTSMILQSVSLNQTMVHGPMCSTLGKNSASDETLRLLLFGQKEFMFPLLPHALTNLGEFEGELVGGNLSLIYESIGAANEVDLAGKVLFLEEIGEEMYAIDRMMNKLKRSGRLEGVKGLILGSFSNIGNSKGYFQSTVESMICKYFPPEIPRAIGLQAGHETVNYSLLMGVRTRVRINHDQIQLHYLD